MSFKYKPGPKGAEFLASRAFVKIAMGPVGGGKSTVALMDLFNRAVTQEPFNNIRRTKFAILRNTIAQLKSTVKPLLDTWFVTLPGQPLGQWRLTENTFDMKFRMPDGSIVWSEYLLLAADTPDDVRRLLSLEVSAAWVEEAREIDPEVFSGLQGRVNRFPARIAGGVTYAGVICSTNPPPLQGFWHGIISEPPKGYEVFIQPPAMLEDGTINPEAENLENLAPDYYDNLVSGKTEEWISVYLKNNFGQGDNGTPVYKSSWKTSFHKATAELRAVAAGTNPLIVGMDNGLTGAAAIGQQDIRGRVLILAESYVPEGFTMGAESFMDKLLIPKLRAEFPQFTNSNIVFVLDPACFQRSQIDERTIAQAVMSRGFKVMKASTNDPERRVQAVEGLLTRQVDGTAGFLVDPRCTHILNAMEWGFRYKKSASGVPSTTIEKNHFSHIGDAVQYLALHYNVQGPVGAMYGKAQARQIVPSGYRYV